MNGLRKSLAEQHRSKPSATSLPWLPTGGARTLVARRIYGFLSAALSAHFLAGSFVNCHKSLITRTQERCAYTDCEQDCGRPTPAPPVDGPKKLHSRQVCITMKAAGLSAQWDQVRLRASLLIPRHRPGSSVRAPHARHSADRHSAAHSM